MLINTIFFIVAHKLHIPALPARAEREVCRILTCAYFSGLRIDMRVLFWIAHRYAYFSGQRIAWDCWNVHVYEQHEEKQCTRLGRKQTL